MTDKVRFDDALERVLAFVRTHSQELGPVVIVRDLIGRFRLAVEHSTENPDVLASELHGDLGAFSPGSNQLFFLKEELLALQYI